MVWLRVDFLSFLIWGSVPIHVALCFVTSLYFRQFGIPTVVRDAETFNQSCLRLLVSTSPSWLFWGICAHAISNYWMGVGGPTFAIGTTPLRTEAMIDRSFLAAIAPYFGGIWGHVLTIFAVARWRFRSRLLTAQSGNAQPTWPCCVSCGYAAVAEAPCPECGLLTPRMLRSAYFGRWHAKLHLSHHRWLTWLPWGIVVLLFFWPLISGVLGSL